MNLPTLTRDIERLSVADAVIAEKFFQHLLRRSGLFALTGIIMLTGLAMFELSAFWMLETTWGSAVTAAGIGGFNCVLGLAFFQVAMQIRPSGDLSIALERRQSVFQSLTDNLSLEASKQAPSMAVRPAIELLSAILVPLIAALLRNLTSQKPDAPRTSA